MRYQSFIGIYALAVALGLASCNNGEKAESETKKAAIKEENITYTADGVTMNGYVAYDSTSTEKRPVVLVVHEWWGLNGYSKGRAKQLAELGYLAIAVDLFGDGKTADNPDDALKLAMPFYQNPGMAKTRFDAALAKIKTYPQAGDKVAAIGYCFGGAVVIGVARLGEDLAGVVSFHGNLNVVPANKDLLKSKILVCYGEADSIVKKDEADLFKKQMDSIGANYVFKTYPGAEHSFTNPNATAIHQKFPGLPVGYNAAADTASWKDMKDFFGTIFK